ncbi:G protein-coupled receptor gpr1 [Recurvomyces mirabilis]|uniref:G protein-coupled receptor gpr1 n=1 Tax=Recurvomyces mirabilis TaxID=574656 RepID=A0AAE0WUP4_9PEZI|nr:G protein-coupled receptor gpr1 [Recurvomyces mirabilis]KAK5160722.1 G protein-coupled receptor gpr1 [Recurvomyces mirabilis]
MGASSRNFTDLALPSWDLRMADHSRMGLSMATSVNASAILAMHERHEVQVMATVMATLSITACLCAMYWFLLMRRNFRRDLVLLLILSDFWKSLWFLIQASVIFTHGQLKTDSTSCQVGGYMITMSIEACDLSILFMSLHMSLQIFPPANSLLGHDGLYRLRHWVLAAFIAIPNTMASLAFANPGSAFQAVGPFCTLPIRPYWYRLALSWIPRYLIWIYIMAVAIRIYKHVGSEFQVFGQEKDRSSSFSMPAESSVDRAMATQVLASTRRKSLAPSSLEVKEKGSDESLAPDERSAESTTALKSLRSAPSESGVASPAASSRRGSVPTWTTPFNLPCESPSRSRSLKSAPTSRRGSQMIATGVMAEDFAPPVQMSDAALARHRGSIATLLSVAASSVTSAPALDPIVEDKRGSTSTGNSSRPDRIADTVLKTRRRAIQRQLRLLFIYPVVYMIIWIIPFVSHCMNYSNYYAQNPIFAISFLNIFCQCFLGFADVCVFCWREKPWKHVPGSDGTFVGSFRFWQFCGTGARRRRLSRTLSDIPDDVEAEGDGQQVAQKGGGAKWKRWLSPSADGAAARHLSETSTSGNGSAVTASASARRPAGTHRRTLSGGSDRKQLEIEQAYTRLALERADFEANRKGFGEKSRDATTELQHDTEPRPAHKGASSKDWWDGEVESALTTIDKEEHERDATAAH